VMAELKRKEEQLTTADLAGRNQVRKEEALESEYRPDRPKAVQSDRPRAVQNDFAGAQQKASGPIGVAHSTPSPESSSPTPLFSDNDVRGLRDRWGGVQTSFVDEPRKSVEEADQLVASVMKRLAEGFANERATLEKQWDRGDQVSTEDLRVALQRYRSFFDRLLSA